MDRYVRVEQRKTEQPSILENEVRIMAAGKMRNYISYATTLLTVRTASMTPFSAGLGSAGSDCTDAQDICRRR